MSSSLSPTSLVSLSLGLESTLLILVSSPLSLLILSLISVLSLIFIDMIQMSLSFYCCNYHIVIAVGFVLVILLRYSSSSLMVSDYRPHFNHFSSFPFYLLLGLYCYKHCLPFRYHSSSYRHSYRNDNYHSHNIALHHLPTSPSSSNIITIITIIFTILSS